MKHGTGGIIAGEFETIEAIDKGKFTNRKVYCLKDTPGIWRRLPLAEKGTEGVTIAFCLGGLAPFVRDLETEKELAEAGFIPRAVPVNLADIVATIPPILAVPMALAAIAVVPPAAVQVGEMFEGTNSIEDPGAPPVNGSVPSTGSLGAAMSPAELEALGLGAECL